MSFKDMTMKKRGIFTLVFFVLILIMSLPLFSANIFSDFFDKPTGKVVSPLCGNGVLQKNEKCDYGSFNGQTCTPQYVGDSCQYCNNECQIVIVDGYPECGNGLIEIGEECDGGNYGSSSINCKYFGYTRGTLRCSGTCQFDSQECKGYSSTDVNSNSVQSSNSCEDSDGGFDIFNFGSITLNGKSEFFDYCLNPDICQLHFGDDDCVLEGVCHQSGLVNALTAECPQGYSCLNGACLKNSSSTIHTEPESGVSSCTDTDGGLNYHLKGTVIGKPKISEGVSTFNDECLTGNSNGDYDLVEYGCGTLEGSVADVGAVPYNYKCPNGCVEGACVSASTCIDTDGGKNYYKKGTITNPDGAKLEEDFCENTLGSEGKVLREYYGCHSFEDFKCLSECSDGACKLNTLQRLIRFFVGKN